MRSQAPTDYLASTEDFFSEDYWINLRRFTSVTGLGKKQCENWVQDVLKIWNVNNVKNLFHGVIVKRYIIGFYHGRHAWLETIVDGKRYIADGTAGQYDESFPLGFYGWLENAPSKPKEFYDLKK